MTAFVLAAATGVRAQAVSGPQNDGATTLNRVALEDLPSSGTLGGFLETTIPWLVSDRIEGGGLSVGSESRFGSIGSSWSQTAFQFDELDLTDPGAYGRSLLFLNPDLIEAVETTTAMMPIERPALGLGVRLIPRRPSTQWRGRAEILSTLQTAAEPSTPVPPIAALRTWNRFSASASGPLRRDRLSASFGLAVNNATRYERNDATVLHAQDTGGFAQILFTPSTTDEFFGLVSGRSAHVPFGGRLWIGEPGARQRASDLMVASHWQHRARQVTWTAAAGVLHGSASAESASVPLAYIDSIRDMPVIDALSDSTSRTRWSAVLRGAGTPASENRWLRGGRAGLEIGGGSATNAPPFAPVVAETVEGFAARVWRITPTAAEARHHATRVTAYAAERIPLSSRVTFDGGIRWEHESGSADNGASIHWSDFYPRAMVRWDVVPERVSGILSVGRYGYRLPLEALAFGDPASPSAQVFRWDDRNGDARFDNGEQGPLVERVGGGLPGAAAIDPRLKRPYLDELAIGIELRAAPAWVLRLTGFARKEQNLIAPANSGVPLSGYTVSTIPDAGGDLIDPSDDQQLLVYDRRPAFFGADSYLLTNAADLNATFDGLELAVWHTGDRLQMMAGATAGQSSGPAAARGFQVFQNDGAIIGDYLSDPNAATFARGSFFSDRSYTIKTYGTYRFPHDVRLGVAARYQDGQPFSRLVIAQGLGQGTEAIRAYGDGRTRFTYTLTVDARVQVGIGLAKQHLTLMWDVFNLLNLGNEVEEFVLTGPAFRTTTAQQPPRAMHFGVRVGF